VVIGLRTVLAMSVLAFPCLSFSLEFSWTITYPSANPAPRRLDLDLPFPTLGLGHLLESQVFFTVEPHGVHHLSRGGSHDAGSVPVGGGEIWEPLSSRVV
jgi:hypothetical protein